MTDPWTITQPPHVVRYSEDPGTAGVALVTGPLRIALSCAAARNLIGWIEREVVAAETYNEYIQCDRNGDDQYKSKITGAKAFLVDRSQYSVELVSWDPRTEAPRKHVIPAEEFDRDWEFVS